MRHRARPIPPGGEGGRVTDKPDMRLVSYLDWAEYFCPCGASCSSRDDLRYGTHETRAFIKKHKPHTSGFCVTDCDESWRKVMSAKPTPERFSL